MQVRIIGNLVKTDTADFMCASREEAEALFVSLRERHADDSSRVARQSTTKRKRSPRKTKGG